MSTASISGGFHFRISVAVNDFPPKSRAEQKLRWRRCKLRARTDQASLSVLCYALKVYTLSCMQP